LLTIVKAQIGSGILQTDYFEIHLITRLGKSGRSHYEKNDNGQIFQALHFYQFNFLANFFKNNVQSNSN
jgi:hypothetical protein